jgi:hypothetical protein
MTDEEFLVASRDPETNETSVDFYQDKDKALKMARIFREDMPERNFYLGSTLERLEKGLGGDE